MNDELKEKAQHYLKEIEAVRKLPFKRSWSKEYKTYTSSTAYAKKYRAPDELPLVVDVKNNIGMYFIIPLWICIPMVLMDGWKTNGSWVESAKVAIAFVFNMIVVIVFENVPGKWVWLRMTHHGLWLTEEHILVKWDDVLWAGIETIPDDDTNEVNFVVNYYDERYNDFREYRTNKQKLSIKNAELCFYIEYFRNQSHGSSKHPA